MDVQQFLSEFGHIANAPGGVARLQDLILFLAVRGKLVEHEATDQSGTDLLDEIAKHKETDTRTRYRILEEITKADEPYSIPKHWAWARLGDLVDLLDSQRQPITKNKRRSGPIPYYGASGIVDYVAEHIFDEDLVLVGEDGAKWARGEATAFKIAGKTWVNNHAHVLRPKRSLIIDDFLIHALVEMDITGFITGMTVPKLNQAKLISIPIPLPPPSEQALIVAKIDELMNLCEQLEKKQQKRRRLQNALRQSTLQAVADAQSPHELEESWHRLEKNFSSLSSAPEDIDDFLVELKSLAVRGLLVSSSLLQPDLGHIKEDRTTLKDSYIAKKMMRKQKTVGMAERDTLYPDHWAVAAFDEVAIVIGGVTKGRNLRDRQTITCPYLAVANVQRGYLKLDRLKSIEITTEELEKYLVVEGDLLITEGGDWDKVGRTAIWRGEIENCLHQNHVFKARVPSDLLLNEWVELVFNSEVGRDYFAGASKQTTNLASINMTQLRRFPMPIPPVDEQKRILETLSSLTELCEDWRSLLQNRQELSASFANAAIASLTGIATDQKEEAPVKAPQTELIAPLRLGTTPDVTAQAPLTTILARHKGELSARDLWQRFGGEIDAFYAQLKTEVAHGWIAEPAVAVMLEKPAEAAGA